VNRTSTKIFIIYLVTGFGWILASDWFFGKFKYPQEHLYQTIKGCGFIFISGILFWQMLRRHEQKSRQYFCRLRDMNQELEQRNAELAVSNIELEQFAYIASHDLQEPLRMVTGFLGQIEKKYSDNLDDKGKEYIHYAVDGASRMKQIIFDLLEYSRVGKKEVKYESFAVGEVIDDVISLNKPMFAENKATIFKGPMPTIVAGKSLIRQVFQNLLANAVKYRNPETDIIITLDFKETPDFWEFSVSDNGIGIKPDQLDKIFVLFQRLHSRERYSGSGIGLSVCKKIVENHGGAIWAESEPGSGSTFYFSLKK